MPATHCRHRLNTPTASLVVALVVAAASLFPAASSRAQAPPDADDALCRAACEHLVAECGLPAPFVSAEGSACAGACVDALAGAVPTEGDCSAATRQVMQCVLVESCESLRTGPTPCRELVANLVGACVSVEAGPRIQQEAVDAIARGLERVREQYGAYPPSLELLLADLPAPHRRLSGPLTDRWGGDLIYRPTADGFELRSVGPDGVEGTEDDLTAQGATEGSEPPTTEPAAAAADDLAADGTGAFDHARLQTVNRAALRELPEGALMCPEGRAAIGLRADPEAVWSTLEPVCGGLEEVDVISSDERTRVCPPGHAINLVWLKSGDAGSGRVSTVVPSCRRVVGRGGSVRRFPLGPVPDGGWRETPCSANYVVGLVPGDAAAGREPAMICAPFAADLIPLSENFPACQELIERTADLSPFLHPRLVAPTPRHDSEPGITPQARLRRFELDADDPATARHELRFSRPELANASETLRCIDSTLSLAGLDYTRSEGGERIEPPLPLVRLPAREAQRIDWTGVWHVTLEGAEASFPGTATVTVSEPERIEVYGRPNRVVTVELRVEAGRGWRRVDVITVAPHLTLIGRTVYDSLHPDAKPIDEWVLRTGEGEP